MAMCILRVRYQKNGLEGGLKSERSIAGYFMRRISKKLRFTEFVCIITFRMVNNPIMRLPDCQEASDEMKSYRGAPANLSLHFILGGDKVYDDVEVRLVPYLHRLPVSVAAVELQRFEFALEVPKKNNDKICLLSNEFGATWNHLGSTPRSFQADFGIDWENVGTNFQQGPMKEGKGSTYDGQTFTIRNGHYDFINNTVKFDIIFDDAHPPEEFDGILDSPDGPSGNIISIKGTIKIKSTWLQGKPPAVFGLYSRYRATVTLR
ncbi:hypothetical protein CPB84DRAFT_1749327 [Gymnopilus junonius]|uniref:Uncharacterized protein n=1 Tax=Gymnopilus junonius TaxID=109634 RepID=A0A9P5TL26_GYMJU|nr:hypothetical protein CPB84DRAFT_1749327 [Gymnopilus junonius]